MPHIAPQKIVDWQQNSGGEGGALLFFRSIIIKKRRLKRVNLLLKKKKIYKSVPLLKVCDYLWVILNKTTFFTFTQIDHIWYKLLH
jgi:hypothetical protein